MDKILKISKTNFYSCGFLAIVCLALSIGAYYIDSKMREKDIPIRPTHQEISYAVNNFEKERLEKFIRTGIELNRNLATATSELIHSTFKIAYLTFLVLGIFLLGFSYSFYKIKKER